MRSWKTILALAICLSLLAGGAAFAKKHEKQAKVMCYGTDDETELKVEVEETDGRAHVKVYEIVDGEETLVEEYEADEGEKRVLEFDGKNMVVITGDDENGEWTTRIRDGHIFVDGDEDVHWMVSTDDDDVTWFDACDSWLGVSLTDLDEDKAEYFDREDGALVIEVIDDSPAESAGFKVYDIITKIGDEKIEDSGDAIEAVRGHEAGDEVEIVVVRKGKEKTLKAELKEREGFAYAFGDGDISGLDIERFRGLGGHGRVLRLDREALTPSLRMHEDEIDNLRADIEELRAMLEELKADRD